MFSFEGTKQEESIAFFGIRSFHTMVCMCEGFFSVIKEDVGTYSQMEVYKNI